MGNAESSLQYGEVSCVLDELRSLEQRLSSIHAVQKQQVEALAQHLARNTQESLQDSLLHPKTSSKSRIGKQEPLSMYSSKVNTSILFGSHIDFGDAKVLVGPVIGKVTETSANILLEVDRECEITCHVCQIDDECPSGREVFNTKAMMKRRRPNVFQLTGLDKGMKYCVVFSGITKEDTKTRIGRFRTFKTGLAVRSLSVCENSPGFIDPNEPDPWLPIAQRVFSDRVDLILHLGGQVDCTNALAQSAMLITHHQLAGLQDKEQEKRIEELVCEHLREVYRSTWNSEPLRSILASTSNMMIWSNLEVQFYNKDHEYAFPLEKDIPLYPSWLLRLVRKVYHEYQRSLWEMRSCEESLLRTKMNLRLDHEFSFHKLSGDFGILFLDAFGAQVREDGQPQQWPDSPLVSSEQISFLKGVLHENKTLSNLVVACDRPIVSFTEETTKKLASFDNTKDYCFSKLIREQWCYNTNELEQVITALFDWDCKANVLIMCGYGGLDCFSSGLETRIFSQNFKYRRMITQLVTAPIALPRIATIVKIELDKQGKFLEKFTYRHFEKRLSTQLSKSFAVFDALPHLELPRNDPRKAEIVSELADFITDGHGKPNILLGPIVGKVTHDKAIIMLEIDSNAYVRCELYEDFITEEQPENVSVMNQSKLFIAQKALCFCFSGLKPERTYKIKLIFDYNEKISDVTPQTQKSMDVGFCGVFRTFPLPIHTLNGIPHSVNIPIVCDDQPHSARYRDSAHSWEDVRAVRGKSPLVIHVGGQIDLEVVAHELRFIIQAHGRNKDPNKLKKSSTLHNKLTEAIKNAYRIMWSLPGKNFVLSNGGNLMLWGLRDVEAPKCFFTTQSLLPWVNTIRLITYEVAREYQLQLHTGKANPAEGEYRRNDTVSMDNYRYDKSSELLGEDVQILAQLEKSAYTLEVHGPVGILCIDLLSSRLRFETVERDDDSPLLTSFEWMVLEEQLKKNSTKLRSLLVLTEFPVIDDSPIDAKTKFKGKFGSPLNENLTKKWPYHLEECIHLLDLLFAWKSASIGREVTIISGNVGVGMESVIEFQQAKMSIQQITVGPITGNPLELFPFQPTGNIDEFDEKPADNGDFNCKYTYQHNEMISGNRMYGTVRIVVGKESDCKTKLSLFSADAEMHDSKEHKMEKKEKIDDAKGLLANLDDSEANLPAWLMAAFVGSEKAKIKKSEEKEREELENSKLGSLRNAEAKILEEHPTARIITGDHRYVKKGKESIITTGYTKEEGFKPDLRWMDFDVNYFSPECVKQLRNIQKTCKEKSFIERVHQLYEELAESNIGILPDKAPELMLKFLSIKPRFQTSLLNGIADFVILRRNYNVIKESIDKNNPVVEM